jgi:predicted kinase
MILSRNQLLEKIKSLQKPSIFVMIGPPASGKSTLSKFIVDSLPGQIEIASTDSVIEAKAKSKNISFEEAFNSVIMKEVKNQMFYDAQFVIMDNRHLIFDQTNMSKKSRKQKISSFPSTDVYAISLEFDYKEILKRNQNRVEKIVPTTVIDKMISSYNTPTTSEGFKKVFKVKV